MGAGRLDEDVGSGGVHHVSGDGRRRHTVELGSGAVTEPAGVHLPDGTHIPGGLAVTFADVEMLWHPDLAHRGVDVGTGVHELDGAVVHSLHGVTHRGDLFGDAIGSLDRSEV